MAAHKSVMFWYFASIFNGGDVFIFKYNIWYMYIIYLSHLNPRIIWLPVENWSDLPLYVVSEVRNVLQEKADKQETTKYKIWCSADYHIRCHNRLGAYKVDKGGSLLKPYTSQSPAYLSKKSEYCIVFNNSNLEIIYYSKEF